MAVRARKEPAVFKSLLLSAVLVCTACGHEGPQAARDAPRRSGAACSSDAQCGSGFCDAGVCAVPSGVYGSRCLPAPRGEDAVRDGKLNACGAYVCGDGRCRSCESARQCMDEYGAPACAKVEGRPGMRCGR